jgi:hypothetical protein
VVSGLPWGTEKWRISRFRHFHPPEISALRAVATTLLSGARGPLEVNESGLRPLSGSSSPFYLSPFCLLAPN